jgi:transposase
MMQYIEGLTDRQADDAVRRCMDWKDALSLDLTDPGFDFTLLHNFRCRLLTHNAGQRKPGHLAQLAPHPLSRQTVLC